MMPDEFTKWFSKLSDEEKNKLAEGMVFGLITPVDQLLPSKIWNNFIVENNPKTDKISLKNSFYFKNEVFYDQAVKEIQKCKTFSAFFSKRELFGKRRSGEKIDWYKAIVSYGNREITGYGHSENEALIQAKNHAVRFVEQELFDKNNTDYSER